MTKRELRRWRRDRKIFYKKAANDFWNALKKMNFWQRLNFVFYVLRGKFD